MAIHAHSTTAPARPLLPLPFVFRPSSPVDDPRSAEDLLREIAAEIERQVQGDTVTVPPAAGAEGVVTTTMPARPELPPEPLLLAESEARTRYLRRQLAAAADHAAALLPALGLPRLEEAGFEPIDLTAAGDALEAAVAALDEADGDPEAEPWLGWPEVVTTIAITPTVDLSTQYELDLEDDSEENEGTALESFGRGFVRAGEDDAEDDDADEDSDPAGCEDDPHPWRFQRPDAVQAAARLCEVARYGC